MPASTFLFLPLLLAGAALGGNPDGLVRGVDLDTQVSAPREAASRIAAALSRAAFAAT